MLNKDQRRVLKYLNQIDKANVSFSEVDFVNSTKIINRKKLLSLCRTLQSEEYIDKIVTRAPADEIVNVTLEYRGYIYLREFYWDMAKAIFKWLMDNLVGFAALVVSIIALLQVSP